MPYKSIEPFSLASVLDVAHQSRSRLQRVTEVLDDAHVPYALAGDAAIAHWISRVVPDAVRSAQDCVIVIRRADLGRIIVALMPIGLVFVEHDGDHLFVEGPAGEIRDAVRILFAGELARSNHVHPVPGVDESEPGGEYRVLSLEPLVRLLLTGFRDQDRMRLLDMIDVGLIDAGWLLRLPPALAPRLQALLDDPQS